MHSQTMAVILAQGPAAKLQRIADAMTTQRGTISGWLQLATTLIPQLQQPPGAAACCAMPVAGTATPGGGGCRVTATSHFDPDDCLTPTTPSRRFG